MTPAPADKDPGGRIDRLTIAASALFVGVLLGASLIEVPVVARGTAIVVPSLETQPIEARGSGDVLEVLVHEGQRLNRGAIVAVMSNPSVRGQLKELQSEREIVRMQLARLSAARNDEAFALEPQWSDGDLQSVAETQAALLQASVRRRSSERDALRAAVSVAEAKLGEAQRKAESAIELENVARERIAFLRNSSRSTPLQLLEQAEALARAAGASADRAAEARTAREGLREAIASEQKSEAAWLDDLSTEEASLTSQLQLLDEQIVVAESQVGAQQLEMPVDGIIQRVLAGPGRVVSSGQPVVEIVPVTDTLFADVRLTPADVAGIGPGLPATLRLDALDYRRYGALAGEVVLMSPDSLEDPGTGARYFEVKLSIDAAALGTHVTEQLIPGMTGSADIVLGDRRIIEYVLRPLQTLTDSAFRD